MLDRKLLIALLRENAALLEVAGANPFKSGAFLKAAETLADPGQDLDRALAEDNLTSLPAIGKGIAEKIREFAETGTFQELEDLRRDIPAGLVEMTRIPGFGAKKALAVHKELGVASIQELEAAARDGRLAKIKGFGAKTAEKVLAGIQQLQATTGLFRLDVAQRAALPLLQMLNAHPAVERVETAGSLRRWKEIVHDIDLVAATDQPEEVMEAFCDFLTVESVTLRGPTKCSVILDGGIPADLRCVTPAQFPFALCHFTGSKEHNVVLRGRARDRNLTQNEYGLFHGLDDAKTDKSLPATTEEDIHRALGLKQFVPPELRENMGEIEAAEAGTLPVLIEEKDIRGLLHMHTHYSDGKPEVEDYAAWAAEHGMAWMGIADHSRAAAYAGGLSEDSVRKQWREIDEVNARYADRGVRLLKGIESDILADGSLDYPEETLRGFDFIVASVHSGFTKPEAEQTARILRAVENPYTTVLGHMTGRLLLSREGYALNQKAVIEACAANGTLIEINANPHRLDVDWRLLKFALEQGAYLSIGPDAHDIAGLMDYVFGVHMARKGWATPDRVANCWSAEEFLAFAAEKRGK